MKKELPGTPLYKEGDWDSAWTLSAASLAELKKLLGVPLLVQLCRCSIAADRLVSLGDFALFNDGWTPRHDISHARNLQTMFWMVCGTLHEAIAAVREMEALGIEGLFGSVSARKPWIELRTLSRRWEEDDVYARVRDQISFHIDPDVIRRRLSLTDNDAEAVVWRSGNAKQDRTCVFTFAQDTLLGAVLGLDTDEGLKAFGDFSPRVRDAHLQFSGLVQELLVEALRGATEGFKLVPPPAKDAEAGHRAQRLMEIRDIARQDHAAGELLKALRLALGEVDRLAGLNARLANDSNLTKVRGKRSAEEQRLRAVDAVARQHLDDPTPAVARRLRELLDRRGPDDPGEG